MNKKILMTALAMALVVSGSAYGAAQTVVNAAGASSAVATADRGTLVIKASTLTVRTGPDTIYDQLTTVKQGETYHYYNEVDGWYCIETKEHVFGWVRSSSVEATPYSYTPSSEITTDYVIEKGVLVDYRGIETEIIIPDTVSAIDEYAFIGHTELTKVTIPTSVKTIGKGAFYGCSGLVEVNLPKSVTTIGDYAFDGCSNLKKVTIPSTVTSIGDFAFYANENLTTVTLPSSLKTIGESAFAANYKLKSIVIPNSVTSVGNGAFANDTSLATVVLSNKQTTIADSTFSGDTALKTITIPKSITSVGDYAFANTYNLATVFYTGSELNWKDVNVSKKDDANSYLLNAGIRYGITVKTPLKIVTQPTDQVVLADAVVNFKVVAEGDDVTYLWQISDDQGKTWRNSKITTPTYSTQMTTYVKDKKGNILSTTVRDGRYVRCIVTDKSGYQVKSNAVKMRIADLKITSQPQDQILKLYGTAVFKISAIGEKEKYDYEKLSYQWQLSDDNGKTWRNSSVTGTTYSTSATEANNGRLVRCVVTDKYNNHLASRAAKLGLRQITIKQQITDQVAKKGEKVVFDLQAEGTNLTYQWQLSDDKGTTWRNSSVKIAKYSNILSDANDGRYVRCLITDQFGNQVYTKAASMSIAKQALKITTQPNNVLGRVGGYVSVKVVAQGNGLTYQWQLSDDGGVTWRNSSVKTAEYTTILTDTNKGRYLRVIVTDETGKQEISKAASINVK